MSEAKGQGDELNPSEDKPLGELRDHVPTELLDISFPVAVRGYDRRAVDAYVKRVNRLIAEIKVTASPRAAVKHALQQIERQVSGLLEQARQTADEITTSAHREAEAEAEAIKAKAAELLVNTNAEAEALKAEAETVIADARTEAQRLVAKAKADAQAIVGQAQSTAAQRRDELQSELASLQEQAEARMRVIENDTAAVHEQRRHLLDDIRATAARLVELADVAANLTPSEPELLDALEPATKVVEPQPSEPDETGAAESTDATAHETVVKKKPRSANNRSKQAARTQ